VVGLGTGSPDLLTDQATRILDGDGVLYVARSTPAIVSAVAERVRIVDLAEPNFSGPDADEAQLVATRLVALAKERPVVFGALGNPSTDDAVTRVIRERARRDDVDVQLVSGVSLTEAALEALGIDVYDDVLQISWPHELVEPWEPLTLSGMSAPNPFRGVYRVADPTRPLLVRDVSGSNADVVRRALEPTYPQDFLLSVVNLDLGVGAAPTVVPLRELGVPGTLHGRNYLYCPPVERLADVAAFDTLRYIVARLRGPGGCPWDREQTFQSIKKHLIEETYEAVAALDDDDFTRFAEEVGDVLLQVVMYAQFGREATVFDLETVLRLVNEKLVRRHPHVFGDVLVGSSADVLKNWEAIKRAEKPGGAVTPVSSFAGIPQAAPALMRAEAVQSRATRYGWTPPSRPPEVGLAAIDDLSQDTRRERLGDAFFDLVALARCYKLDPEEALRLATNRFVARIEADLRSNAEHETPSGSSG